MGELIYSKPLISWGDRLRFLDMANKIRGRYTQEKINLGMEFEERDKKLASIPDDVLKNLAKAHIKAREKEESPA